MLFQRIVKSLSRGRAGVGLLILVVLVLLGRYFGGLLPALEAHIDDLGYLAYLLFLVLYVPLTMLFVPMSAFAFLAGASFDLPLGVALVLAGTLLNSLFSFVLSRRLMRSASERLLARYPRLASINRIADRRGLRFMFLLRFTPIHFSLLNYLLGASRVRFGAYILACAGMIPMHSLLVYVGHVAAHVAGPQSRELSRLDQIILYGGLGVALLAVALITLLARRALAEDGEFKETDSARGAALRKDPAALTPFDERDTVFARARLRQGEELHSAYYSAHPERLAQDEKTRDMPQLASSGGRRYRPAESALVEAQFSLSDLIAEAVERAGVGLDSVRPSAIDTERDDACTDGAAGGDALHTLPDESPAGLSAFAKEAADFLGADDVGICRLDPAHVYSRRGRPLSEFGKRVDLPHRIAVVMVFVMREEYVQTSPEMLSTAETARVYQQAAAASFALADAFKRCGHPARAHVDSNYLLVCPPLAIAAGLGELGRNGILVHPRFGPGVRLGVVTVDAELATDDEGCWGIAEFCRSCAKCAQNCPSGAIPKGETQSLRGAEKWPLNAERCYHYWRGQGTDCGICMRVCPFQKHDTILHRAVRRLIASTGLFNRWLLRFDDWFYGSSPEARLGAGLPFRQGAGSKKSSSKRRTSRKPRRR